MKFPRWQWVLCGFVLVLSGYSLVQSYQSYRKYHPAAESVCVAKSNEMCPSEDFVKEYREWDRLRRKYEPPKDVQIQLRGYLSDLQSQIPAGYGWDEKSGKLVQQPVVNPPSK